MNVGGLQVRVTTPEEAEEFFVYQYLLRARPVVSRPLPALAPYRQWYREAVTAEEFVAAIGSALAENGESAAVRRHAAEAFGWDERAAVLYLLRRELLGG